MTTSRAWILKISASSNLNPVRFGLLLTFLIAPAVAGQGFQVSGRVLAVLEGDTIPVGGTAVALHRVDAAGGAEIDSAVTDEAGQYVLRASVRDSALYIPAVAFREIAYFGSAIRIRTGFTMDTSETILVYDTSSVGDPLFLAEKHFVVREPNPDGSRPVLELLVIENRSDVVRITNNPAVPVWSGALPDGALDLEVAPSDVSPDAIRPVGSGVGVMAPIPPGQKQLVYGYTLPAGSVVRLPVTQPIGRIQLLLSDTAAAVTSPYLSAAGVTPVDRFMFSRWEGAAPDPVGDITITFAAAPFAIEQYWWVIVVLGGVGFAAALGFALRRPQTVPVTQDPRLLAARVAELDASIAAGGAPESVVREREDLRAQLAAVLARRERPT